MSEIVKEFVSRIKGMSTEKGLSIEGTMDLVFSETYRGEEEDIHRMYAMIECDDESSLEVIEILGLKEGGEKECSC